MSASRSSRSRGRAALAFVAGFACGLAALAALRVLVTGGGRDSELELFRAVHERTAATYVDEVDRGALVDAAIRGMVDGLDPFSRYFGPDDLAGIDRETRGEYRGIGVVFREPLEAGQIRFTLPGSPADRAGLDVGDRILAVDGTEVASMDPGDLRARLGSAEAGELRLLVEPREGEAREVALRPEAVIDPTVRHVRMLDPALGIGYLAVLSFSHRTPEEFDRWMTHLEERGLRALVLDLRANPGGILDSAVRVADRFVREGVIVSTRTREDTRSVEATPEATLHEGLPLAVLIDGDSASASEVLAAALGDHRAAVLVGERTYGKGAVQTLSRFEPARAILKLTTSHYLTPAGRRIARDDDASRGVAPDVEVPVPDAARAEVHRFLRGYSPPPDAWPALEAWEREEGVQLVARPPDDPQLDAALALLRGDALPLAGLDGGTR